MGQEALWPDYPKTAPPHSGRLSCVWRLGREPVHDFQFCFFAPHKHNHTFWFVFNYAHSLNQEAFLWTIRSSTIWSKIKQYLNDDYLSSNVLKSSLEQGILIRNVPFRIGHVSLEGNVLEKWLSLRCNVGGKVRKPVGGGCLRGCYLGQEEVG